MLEYPSELKEKLQETKTALFLVTIAKNLLCQDEYIKLLRAFNTKKKNDGKWIGIDKKNGAVIVLYLN